MKSKKIFMKIGDIAREAETTVRTVRYYLEEGFIDYAVRSDGGFYLFEFQVVEKIRFIKKLKELGLPLKEIKALYQIRQEKSTGHEAYKLVHSRLEKQHELTTKKIKEYMELKVEIEDTMKLVNRCVGCKKKPSRENCVTCDVVKKWDVLPLPFGAIL